MRILLLATLLVVSASASAGLYKWVDENGNVHYSQKPPRDKQYKKLRAPAPVTTSPQPLYKSVKIKPDAPTKEDEFIASKQAEIKRLRAKNCKQSRENLKNYQIYRRFKNNKTGEVTIITEEERARQLEKARQGIKEFCN